jgi:epoxyqueuosine reductase QueG
MYRRKGNNRMIKEICICDYCKKEVPILKYIYFTNEPYFSPVNINDKIASFELCNKCYSYFKKTIKAGEGNKI